MGTLRLGLAVVLIGSALGLLTKAGADIPAPVLASVPLALAALIGAQHLRRRPAAERERRVRAPLPQPER